MQEAIKVAKAYVVEVYRKTPPKDLRLEEIERSEDGRDWLITLGYQSFDYNPSLPGDVRQIQLRLGQLPRSCMQ